MDVNEEVKLFRKFKKKSRGGGLGIRSGRGVGGGWSRGRGLVGSNVGGRGLCGVWGM